MSTKLNLILFANLIIYSLFHKDTKQQIPNVIINTMAIIVVEDIIISFAVTSCVPILNSFLSIQTPAGIVSLSQLIFSLSFFEKLSSNTEDESF